MIIRRDEARRGALLRVLPAGKVATDCGMLNGMADLSVSITCPACQQAASATMPDDRCVVSYECPSCGTTLRPLAGDCCVFCSYGDKRCPFVQDQRECSGTVPSV